MISASQVERATHFCLREPQVSTEPCQSTIHPLLGDNARFNDGGARCSVTPWLCHVTDTFDANDQLSVTFAQAHPEVFTFVQSGL